MLLVTNSAHLIAPFTAVFETIPENPTPGVVLSSTLAVPAAMFERRNTSWKRQRILSTCQDGFSCYLAAFSISVSVFPEV